MTANFEPELVHIPAGEFLMGGDPDKDKHAKNEEQPQHILHLPDYTIAKAPVTNAQYLAFLEATDYSIPKHWVGGKPPGGKEDHPVVYVTWHDALAFCKWLAEATGRPYRLPGEAEWEKAARGTDGRIYPWGDQLPDKNRCNFGRSVDDTTPVGHYSPQGDSPYGCVDMAGNVWEWCYSLYRSYPYDPNDGREDPEADDNRALRGGSWFDDRRLARASSRYYYHPGLFSYYVGFRVVVAPV